MMPRALKWTARENFIVQRLAIWKPKTELPDRLWEAAGAPANCLHRLVGITSVPAANLGTGHALKI